MHTIDGIPATFCQDQICFATRYHPVELKNSLNEIKKDQRKTLKYRADNNFNMHFDYSWMRVKV